MSKKRRRKRAVVKRDYTRREFVQTSAGILVAAAVGNACTDPNDPNSGFVQVTINGLETATQFGTATITGGGLTQPLEFELTAASGSQSVIAGTYHVEYEPPGGFVIATGTPTSADVEITTANTEDNPAIVQFTVIASNVAPGTLNITVTNLGAAPDAGSVSVLRTDIGGQTPQLFNIALPGTRAVALNPGTYSVTYNAPSGFRLQSGSVSPQNATITSGGNANVSFAIEAQPVVGGVVFNSDWSTALGNSDAAMRDTGKTNPWTIASVGIASIITNASAQLDFPTANVLSIPSTQGSGAIMRRVGIPVPAVGNSLYYRWYMRQTHADNLTDNETHPVQDGNAASDCNWMFKVYHNEGGPGHWRPVFHLGGNPFHNSFWTGPVLDKGVTYRFEVQVHRVTTTTWNLHARIFTAAGAPLADDDDFNNFDVANTVDERTLTQLPSLLFLNVNNLNGLNSGCNGIASPPAGTFQYGYQAAFVVRTDQFPGPYAGGI